MSLGAGSVVAVGALERLLASVNSQMGCQRRLVFAAIVALIAGKGLFVAVFQLVDLEIARRECGERALVALERPFTGVGALVFGEVVLELESLVAHVAGKRTFVRVETFVNGEVTFDREGLAAAREGANKRPFSRMNVLVADQVGVLMRHVVTLIATEPIFGGAHWVVFRGNELGVSQFGYHAGQWPR
jgi:hypothetical protein